MLQATGYPAEIADFYSAISAGYWGGFLVAKIVQLVIIVHVAMETTKKSNFTCQSKSFISIFFTCQVSACELQSFSYHDLANDIKAGFKEKIRFFKLFWKVIINCLILRISLATQLSTNSLFAWNQFSFLDEQKNRCRFPIKIDGSR